MSTFSRTTLDLKEQILSIFQQLEAQPHRQMIAKWLENVQTCSSAREAHLSYDDLWLRVGHEAERVIIDDEEAWAYDDSLTLNQLMYAVEAWLVLASHELPALKDLGRSPSEWDTAAIQEYNAAQREQKRQKRAAQLTHLALEDRVRYWLSEVKTHSLVAETAEKR